MGTSQTGTPPNGGQTVTGSVAASTVAQKPAAPQEDMTPKIKDLYAQLKQAMESKSLSGVTGCISNQWQAQDGTDLSSLQSYLTKAFKSFDEIRFAMQGLKTSTLTGIDPPLLRRPDPPTRHTGSFAPQITPPALS